ncbi:hypothetical protein JQ617_00395 [Bradyrhizobium sp. KB893862 SZCCT0404]|uniref:hypothetical protein n=1 Tax=Bradyrhizobium sp. KB893862 SZCCT0404 TaxID=2807672 RepID=UPI001BADB04B|nr:hypothetical protein [Bradyrhizobium sp. KB893862 SZCCT0404]MBR1172400.1 hypothetical protein [Bradyrhizobium sp. KB893862 SZCCT0404]
MKRVILTGSCGADLMRSGLAEVVIPFMFRLVDGPLPLDELAVYVAARSGTVKPGRHWSDYIGRRTQSVKEREHLSLVAFCQPYDVIELWFDRDPNDQLQLIWLLDYLRSHPEIAAKTELRLIAFDLLTKDAKSIAKSLPHIPAIGVTAAELGTASIAWQAYTAPTPEACIELVHSDLSALLMLRPALIDLLAEIPSVSTGLGETEVRFLELIGRGYQGTNALFHLRSVRRTRVFREWELGWLLHGLAFGPRPAVVGLDDELRTIPKEDLGARHAAYLRSRLSLTEFGKELLAAREDFSRHNPIDRWWGGTHLTNERLWRYGAGLTKP